MNLENKKSLIVYFSHRGQNYFNGKIIDLSIGNTETIAKLLVEQTGGDIFEIEAVNQYPFIYDDCTAVAKGELQKNARPELKHDLDISQYDVIFIGYPNWWGTMPMPLWTFLETHDLGKKVIFPFCTHEGSAMGTSEVDLKKLCPNSHLIKGLAIKGSSASRAKESLINWIERGN